MVCPCLCVCTRACRSPPLFYIFANLFACACVRECVRGWLADGRFSLPSPKEKTWADGSAHIYDVTVCRYIYDNTYVCLSINQDIYRYMHGGVGQPEARGGGVKVKVYIYIYI